METTGRGFKKPQDDDAADLKVFIGDNIDTLEEILNSRPPSLGTGTNSHVEGEGTVASGANSHAEGQHTTASNGGAHAEGDWSTAGGWGSHAEGGSTLASANYAHSEGQGAKAQSDASHAEGYGSEALRDSVIELQAEMTEFFLDDIHDYVVTIASNPGFEVGDVVKFRYYDADGTDMSMSATIQDIYTDGDGVHLSFVYYIIEGDTGFPEGALVIKGTGSRSRSLGAHAEGYKTVSGGDGAHAEGFKSKAYGDGAHAEGVGTVVIGGSMTITGGVSSSISNGKGTLYIDVDDVSMYRVGDVVAVPYEPTGGGVSYSNQVLSAVQSTNVLVQGVISPEDLESWVTGTTVDIVAPYESVGGHAEGIGTSARYGAHAEGYKTKAYGDFSHAEGYVTIAGMYSHAEGKGTEAKAPAAHAEGWDTKALGEASHAEGWETTASGSYSHSGGYQTTASGYSSHAEGAGTTASGSYSHAEGGNTVASGNYSHAAGLGTQSKHIQTVIGQYNTVSSAGDTSYNAANEIFIIGNGTGTGARGNAFKVLGNGNTYADAAYTSTGADYAEMFEWVDGNTENEDRVGFFVTLDGDKIRKATASDSYIAGVISATPSIIGDAGGLRWQGKYITDDWGRVQYQDVLVPAGYDTEGRLLADERVDSHPVLNPEWDGQEIYTPRSDRQEWAAVGMMGKLLVRDDGTCVVNGFCKPNDDGIATPSVTTVNSYRVMKRVGENIVQILVK